MDTLNQKACEYHNTVGRVDKEYDFVTFSKDIALVAQEFIRMSEAAAKLADCDHEEEVRVCLADYAEASAGAIHAICSSLIGTRIDPDHAFKRYHDAIMAKVSPFRLADSDAFHKLVADVPLGDMGL